MTLNVVMAVILRYSTEFDFGANGNYVKVVEDRPILSAIKIESREFSFSNIRFMAIFEEVSDSKFVGERHPLSKAII